MSFWATLNRAVFKRTSTFFLAGAAGAFFFERTFDVISVAIFESINKGVSILLCNLFSSWKVFLISLFIEECVQILYENVVLWNENAVTKVSYYIYIIIYKYKF